ncbi:hypothetical protein PSTG_16925 [Puccinia striiformis f. sp. tritici PST-78]|uniref:Uncharacterized protein n=2 Tax=Puccinia striiformis f. sp. tritici TaxID=168172 RepID=A0A0L0USA5_9BASI|nr:hypothetical protein PSTG_16925 [Puccinia striiformis f. sp. tritici PST-78]
MTAKLFKVFTTATQMSGQSDPHTTASTSAATTARRTMGSEIYNLIPPKAPPNLMNSELYAGRSAKPVPMEFSLPLRWQRGSQFLAVSLSMTVGVWGVLFADFGNGDREIVFSPIRRWFAPYKSLIFGSDHLPSPSPEIVTNPDSNFPSTIEPNTN